MYIPCQIDSRRQNRQVCDQSRDRHCGGRLRRPPPREPPGPDPGPVVASPFNRLSPPAPDCRRSVGAGHGAGHRSWRQQPASAFPRAAGLATDRHFGGRLRRPPPQRPPGPDPGPVVTVAAPFVRLSPPAPVGRRRLGAGHGATRRSVGADHGAGSRYRPSCGRRRPPSLERRAPVAVPAFPRAASLSTDRICAGHGQYKNTTNARRKSSCQRCKPRAISFQERQKAGA
jgi:hypothetical protein